jgi:hypothetical protein
MNDVSDVWVIVAFVQCVGPVGATFNVTIARLIRSHKGDRRDHRV